MSEIVNALRKQRGWLVRVKGLDMELVRVFNGRPITLTLSRTGRDALGRDMYRLRFPTYIFQSTISHFAPSEEEHRFCRNKSLLFQVIAVLKRSEAWNLIANKDFMTVNTANKKSDKKKLKNELESLHTYIPRELTKEKAKKAAKAA